MQYTNGVGLATTAAEIAALVAFSRDSDDAKVSVRVGGGKLTAWAVNGIAAVYNHGDSWDGKGKASSVDHAWQITAETLKSLKKMMGADDELILHTNNKNQLVEAEIRAIETSQSKLKINLDGHVAEQLDLDLPNSIPTRPGRNTGEIPTSELVLGWTVISLLKYVAKAANTDACRFFISSNPEQQIYVEVDQPSRLYDEEQPRWVCVLMPTRLSSAADDSSDEDSDA